MRKEILASVALAALLAAAPAWAQSSSGTAPAAPAQTERSDAAKTDATKPADAERPASAATSSGTAAGTSATSAGRAASGSSEAPKAGIIAAQQQDQLTAENLIGMDVRNPQDEKIGEIEDLVLSSDMRVEGIVVSVGGFLGLGKHDVALTRDQVQIQTKGDRNERVATVNMTKDQLKAAPQFKTIERQRAESDAERARQQQGTTAGSGATMPPTTTPPARNQ